MEMQIASMAMSMSEAKVAQGVTISMLKKNMEASEQSMQTILDMLDSIPSPDGKGELLNVRV